MAAHRARVDRNRLERVAHAQYPVVVVREDALDLFQRLLVVVSDQHDFPHPRRVRHVDLFLLLGRLVEPGRGGGGGWERLADFFLPTRRAE